MVSKNALQLEKLEEIHISPATNMIVTYALSVVEEAIPSTYMKAEISLESKMWKDAMMEKMNSLHKNDSWELSGLPKKKKAIS